ncbi:hypothetical protein DERP_010410 [Dermatophagoides pteronyssinus]|uniref:Uncharacterized protein n=1 Tax=Dermatophagoides pteronyssinus TaxID=6956 RepID=A0ABQ8J543_DERPT|nr:hypothetical protein DERP_010410 [Dermatophagoides pteronyssinus]
MLSSLNCDNSVLLFSQLFLDVVEVVGEIKTPVVIFEFCVELEVESLQKRLCFVNAVTVENDCEQRSQRICNRQLACIPNGFNFSLFMRDYNRILCYIVVDD